MYIKFIGNENTFIMEVQAIGDNQIRLFPPFPDVDLSAGFQLLTKPEGKVYGDYTDYTTIYREMDDGSVILSNNNNVYIPPVYEINFEVENGIIVGEQQQTPENWEDLVVPSVIMNKNWEFVEWVPEIPTEGKVENSITFHGKSKYIPTLEELKAVKKAEIAEACNAIISAGVDVVFQDGHAEHFSLEENLLKHDQLELFGKQVQLAAGVELLEYHQDGHPCKYYTAEEMQLIITIAMQHVSYHRTYCNSLNMWIAGAETAEELDGIFYGADIPEEYQSEVLKSYIAAIMTGAEATINAGTGNEDEQETVD